MVLCCRAAGFSHHVRVNKIQTYLLLARAECADMCNIEQTQEEMKDIIYLIV
jgi:hypothetical protein